MPRSEGFATETSENRKTEKATDYAIFVMPDVSNLRAREIPIVAPVSFGHTMLPLLFEWHRLGLENSAQANFFHGTATIRKPWLT
jgi:hypothetical protein